MLDRYGTLENLALWKQLNASLVLDTGVAGGWKGSLLLQRTWQSVRTCLFTVALGHIMQQYLDFRRPSLLL